MRILILFLICFLAAGSLFASSPGYVELDLNTDKLSLVDFVLGDFVVSGDFFFVSKDQEGSLIVDAKGEDVTIGQHQFPWIKMRLIKKDNKISLNYFRSDKFLLRGDLDLNNNKVSGYLEINNLITKRWGGALSTKVKYWGTLTNIMISGSAIIRGGNYKGNEFEYAFYEFLGKPPILSINDSEILFKNGSIYKTEGIIDLASLVDIFPKAEFVPQRIAMGEWQLLSDKDRNVGLIKNIDDKFDIRFDTSQDQEAMDSGAELRYNIRDGQFLRIRMQDNDTLIGYEKRKEF